MLTLIRLNIIIPVWRSRAEENANGMYIISFSVIVTCFL